MINEQEAVEQMARAIEDAFDRNNQMPAQDFHLQRADIAAKAALAVCPYKQALEAIQWRDISTAPKDGRRVIVYSRFFATPMVAFYQRFPNHECWEGENRHRKLDPTHWMPLPEPPEVQSND